MKEKARKYKGFGGFCVSFGIYWRVGAEGEQEELSEERK